MDLLNDLLRVLNEIMVAGNAITAMALLLYALTFNLRDRVSRTFAPVMGCVAVVSLTDVLAGTALGPQEVEAWLRVQWLGIAFIPATYMHFADALLEATGRPSRGRRFWAVRLAYALGLMTFLLAAQPPLLLSGLDEAGGVPYLTGGLLFPLFLLFFFGSLGIAASYLLRAYRRCRTTTSRRRMRYLLLGAAGPVLIAYPFLTAGGPFLMQWPLVFWTAQTLINLLVAVQIVLMAYVVAYYGISYPDRVVKSRLFQWLLRGPVVASTVLAVTVVVNRASQVIGWEGSRLVPLAMVSTLLLLQYAITLVRPSIERWLFYGQDRRDMIRLQLLEDRLLTSGDLRQFLESILNAVSDVTGAASAFLATMVEGRVDLEVAVGGVDPLQELEGMGPLLGDSRRRDLPEIGPVFAWDSFWLIPLHQPSGSEIIGLMGLRTDDLERLSAGSAKALAVLSERAAFAIAERLLQREVFQAVDRLVPQAEEVQRLRAVGRYAGSDLLLPEAPPAIEPDLVHLVREALTHYWGGPRLTRSPLIGLRVVQEAIDENNGNAVNALRSVLSKAVERVRPIGERRFTAEWMLYNILEMKFLEGRKVRDVALRLAMSEADLYRKQRVAIEAVAVAISQMEKEAAFRNGRHA
ncbi:MAG TPA: histidine kinase N-terminal 7TM domain-containing protein [Anaerolineales bacterium]|nr:histidine kinase N-terminal 7TM domain-containing protein [Anaerolineales bacterium]